MSLCLQHCIRFAEDNDRNEVLILCGLRGQVRNSPFNAAASLATPRMFRGKKTTATKKNKKSTATETLTLFATFSLVFPLPSLSKKLQFRHQRAIYVFPSAASKASGPWACLCACVYLWSWFPVTCKEILLTADGHWSAAGSDCSVFERQTWTKRRRQEIYVLPSMLSAPTLACRSHDRWLSGGERRRGCWRGGEGRWEALRWPRSCPWPAGSKSPEHERSILANLEPRFFICWGDGAEIRSVPDFSEKTNTVFVIEKSHFKSTMTVLITTRIWFFDVKKFQCNLWSAARPVNSAALPSTLRNVFNKRGGRRSLPGEWEVAPCFSHSFFISMMKRCQSMSAREAAAAAVMSHHSLSAYCRLAIWR